MHALTRSAAALAAPLVAAASVLPATPALAAPPAAARRAASQHAAGDPVGGAQLGGRGVVVNGAPGVKAPPKINASSYLIADMDTGDVLAAKDPHGQYLPASTLKTLTALALVPKLDPNRLVRPSQAAVDVEGTKVGMTTKMQYKVSDLFMALMMMSANDAAVTLAEADGGMAKTIADMNAEARRINARDTLAASPNGLDVDMKLTVRTQHTSSYDLALILREGLKNPDYLKYVQTIDHHFPAPPTKKQRKKHQQGGYPIHTHNHMLPGEAASYPGMIGGKNGYTIAAHQTFVAAAKRGGHTIIIALMRADVPPSPYAAKLLDWGFAARGKVKPVGTLVAPGDPAAKKDTGPGGKGTRNLLPGSPLNKDGTASRWLVGGGTVGVLLAISVLILVLWRRRHTPPAAARPGRPAASPPPPAPAPDDDPDASYDQHDPQGAASRDE
ncbi:D-alanyl-D-alanine carboxypeptidase family protein [Actinomadura parmotrematis]|uniref:D-alanyl-D-alanine carboxypeptidase n=1 Tax=Actinomadura parmotrematis TaxID=2864039 RepID=A0ABS7G2Z6_9ACTN|nr:D-alanyl-D-alanine carboxypeptidase [Actinomadura parmotrematis]MBW8486916.1 D-alanyl-D-alanine carboxypeptidase [Actinomadura parmotrematis]